MSNQKALRHIRAEEAAIDQRQTHQHRKQIPSLTGIRGVAAMWVLLLHGNVFAELLKLPYIGKPLPVVGSGYLGVDLFFMLSGFVLMLNYGSSFSKRRWHAVRDFAIGRVSRILPLHWTTLLLFLPLWYVTRDPWLNNEPSTPFNFFLSASLLQTPLQRSGVWNPPAWSLSAEWVCYFAFPAAAIFFARLRSTAAILFAVAVPAALLMGVMALLHGKQASLHPIGLGGLVRCACEMAMGMALAVFATRRTVGAGAGNFLMRSGIGLFAAAMFGGYADFLCLPAFAAIILGCFFNASVATRLFGNRMVVWLGEVSFSLYILHFLVFKIVTNVVDHLALPAPAAVALLLLVPFAMLPVAWLAREQIEVRGQAIGRAITQYLRGPRRTSIRSGLFNAEDRPVTPS